jgi:hypothetical protein
MEVSLEDALKFLTPANISQYFLFFIPGFISMQIGALLVPVSDDDFGKRIPVAVGYSALNFALMSLVTGATDHFGWTLTSTALRYLFLFVLPFFYPFILKSVREHQVLGITTPFPTAWDEILSKRKQYWIRVHFKNGKVVTGWFGEPGSAASQYPEAQQLYMSEIWQSNGNGGMEKVPRSAGMLVSMTEVRYLEFLI